MCLVVYSSYHVCTQKFYLVFQQQSTGIFIISILQNKKPRIQYVKYFGQDHAARETELDFFIFVSKSQIIAQADVEDLSSVTSLLASHYHSGTDHYSGPHAQYGFTNARCSCQPSSPATEAASLSSENISSQTGCLYQGYRHRNKSRKM